MIYYPISTLMLAGIRDILIITTPHDQSQFMELLGDGSDFGVSFQYAIQDEPKGLAQAFTIGEKFLSEDSCLMILGDNIFHGAGLGRDLVRDLPTEGAHIFIYEVSNPSDYGILEISEDLKPLSIKEKPIESVSKLAVTGLYFFDKEVPLIAGNVKPSSRGELEITSIIDHYLKNNLLSFTQLSRGSVWLDTGNPSRLSEAGEYVRIIEDRTGLKIGCLEEIAYNNAWIDAERLNELISKYKKNDYYQYLSRVIR
jgi:glucose-1-phosphate thymidylyltransferase